MAPKGHGLVSRPAILTGLTLACLVLTLALEPLPLIANPENRTIDLRMRVRAAEPGFGREVLVVLLDDQAMARYAYRSPVPRDMLAQLIGIVSRAGAKVIGLDVFLKDPSWPEQDRALVEAMRESGRVVPISTLRRTETGLALDLPGEPFRSAALATGLADLPIDPVDQIVRRVDLDQGGQGRFPPPLSVCLFLVETKGEKAFWPPVANLGRLKPDLDPSGEKGFRIDFRGPPSTTGREDAAIRTIPASAVLTGLLPTEWFADRYVLIGAGYSDNTDSFRTPYYSSGFDYKLTPGVEIHATALATILAGKTVHHPGRVREIGLLVLLIALVMLLEWFLKPGWAALSTVLCLALYTWLAFYAFERLNLILPIVPAGLALALAYFSAVAYRSLTEGRQRRWISRAFSRYITPQFVDILVKNPELLELGGEERELTIMFTDIKGFTRLSESIPPRDLVGLLNRYFDGMTRILLDHGGTLDKYEGDAMVAFWNAPLDQPDHRRRALDCAREMISFVERLNQERATWDRAPLHTRIGINTGRAVVGNIGSKERFNYTVIGDQVNLAARLEGANKFLGTSILATEEVGRGVEGIRGKRVLGGLKVLGRDRPVGIFELMAEGVCSDDDRLRAGFAKGLEAFQAGEFSVSLGIFSSLLELCPNDGPSKIYRDQSIRLAEEPPGADWQGELVLDEK